MMRIVLLGAPGSGKGTQAQRLQAKYSVPQVSSGDLLRDAVARGTELGLKAKAVMDSGQLVSDDIVLGLIRDRLSRPDAANGFILDGFPRNSDQANSLSSLLEELGQPLDAVLLLDVRNETLMQRLAGRRTCPKCGTVYNVHTMSPGTTSCAKDGTDLIQRPDDKEEVIGKRLEVYAQQTRPLIDHYSKLGLLRAIAGEGELDDVFERMEAAALAKPVPAAKVSVRRQGKALPKAKAKPAAKSAAVKTKRTAPDRSPSGAGAGAQERPPVKAVAKQRPAAKKTQPVKKAKAASKAKTAKRAKPAKAKAKTRPKSAAKRKAKPRAKK